MPVKKAPPPLPTRTLARGPFFKPTDPIPFAREVWPTLRVGTKVIVYRGHGEAQGRIRGHKEGVGFYFKEFNTAGRPRLINYDEAAAVSWHPDETGLDLITREEATANV